MVIVIEILTLIETVTTMVAETHIVTGTKAHQAAQHLVTFLTFCEVVQEEVEHDMERVVQDQIVPVTVTLSMHCQVAAAIAAEDQVFNLI